MGHLFDRLFHREPIDDEPVDEVERPRAKRPDDEAGDDDAIPLDARDEVEPDRDAMTLG